MESFTKDNLKVNIYENRDLMGRGAAIDISLYIHSLLKEKNEISIIFAAAPSQNDVLKYLVLDKSISWERINAYHMDEYIWLSDEAKERFSNYLDTHIFKLVNFKSINYLKPNINNPNEEIERYSNLLKENQIDLVVMGVGENGHIAFNDPAKGLFSVKELVKVVKLDEVCRNQQVHDGCFKTLDDVPKFAMTLTIIALCSATRLFCVVPGTTKANAIKEMIEGEVTESCPASILRKHKNACLYLDKDSSALL
ncbi:MAG: glucosamine-6-phosphate deaminase [Bacilli bacterium]|nr:glucosamine-6-phosphate deaminase [Bacilli bacterium]